MRCCKSKSKSEGNAAAVGKTPSGDGDDNHGACLSSQAFFVDLGRALDYGDLVTALVACAWSSVANVKSP